MAFSTIRNFLTTFVLVSQINFFGFAINVNNSNNLIPDAPVANPAINIQLNGTFTANWSAVPGSTGYKVDVATNSSFTTFFAWFNNYPYSSSTLSVSVPGLAGTTYYYRIRAVNASGTSVSSNVIIVAPLPTAPVVTAATSVTGTSFLANWNSGANATSYRLDVSVSSSFSSLVAGYNDLAVSGLSYNVTGLIGVTTYYYRVRSINSMGSSVNSNAISVITSLDAPVAIAPLLSTSGSFNAACNLVAGATSYRLDVSTTSDFSTMHFYYNNFSSSGSSIAVYNGINGNTVYYFRIRAVSGSTTTGNSNTVSVLTLPNAPTATAATSVTPTSLV